ncbi:MAG: AIPR family protein [Salinivirgaceae bacterium]|nr:AIPR family protein [Salinivirgaceae bacterium]
MATLNDFKILNQKCLKHFEIAVATLKLSDDILQKIDEQKKKNFGFYYCALQYILNETNYEVLTEIICDTDFNVNLFNIKDQDAGVDAVYFDEEEHQISIFNFKFRPNFNKDKAQSINESIQTVKFLNVIKTENYDSLSGKPKEFAKKIIDYNNSDEVWKTTYYIVSNENITIDTNNSTIRDLSQVQGIEIKAIGLDEIVDFMSIHPANVNAELLLPRENVMTYAVSNLVTDKSYNLSLSLTDIIRITCNDEQYRKNTNVEDDSELTKLELENSVLYENVRGYILRSEYNANIFKSLENEPEKFFFFNNGITIVAEDISAQEVNTNRKLKLSIRNFQVLNGGQTLRTIHKFNKEDSRNIEKLSKASIMVRIMKVTDDDLKSRISEFTNSQNSISQKDLKSMRKEQVQLQQYLEDYGILYIRKSGDIGEKSQKKYDYHIDIELLGQILYAICGFPGQVSNKKKDIFSKNYNSIFLTDDLLSEKTVTYIKAYYSIKELYKEKYKKSYMDLKVFFILYLSEKLRKNDYQNIIEEFEKYLENTRSEEKDSRRLIKVTFLSELKRQFNIN